MQRSFFQALKSDGRLLVQVQQALPDEDDRLPHARRQHRPHQGPDCDQPERRGAADDARGERRRCKHLQRRVKSRCFLVLSRALSVSLTRQASPLQPRRQLGEQRHAEPRRDGLDRLPERRQLPGRDEIRHDPSRRRQRLRELLPDHLLRRHDDLGQVHHHGQCERATQQLATLFGLRELVCTC